MKLTIEQREELADMQAGWDSVMKLANIPVNSLRERIFTVDVSKSGRELVLLRARYEGAMDVVRALSQVKEQINGRR